MKILKNLLFLLSVFCFFSMRSQNITLSLVQDGFSRPLNIQNAGDDRLFIVEQGGKIKIIHPDGSVSQFFDISNKISSGGERGLLGLAFHPQYQANGRFYVNYTNLSGNTHISQFSVMPDNPDLADMSTELLILNYNQPAANHNGGDLMFGPDGYLYISSGDGGQAGDPNNRAQDLNQYLGKILRIDVDQPDGQYNYSVPSDNPFINDPNAKPEIWAYGLRNPWRFTIDEVENNIWIADVGQAQWEEINKQSLTSGGLNYGWRCYEANAPFNASNCPSDSALTFPVATYSHENGNCSITGGRVYRGMEYPNLQDLYFFADYCSGIIGTVNLENHMNIIGNFDGNWTSFGEDWKKELYIADITGGKIFKINGETSGIQEEQNATITIFPNPANNQINISTTATLKSVILLDPAGRELFRMEHNPRNILDTSTLHSGIYFLKITTETNKIHTYKIIIR